MDAIDTVSYTKLKPKQILTTVTRHLSIQFVGEDEVAVRKMLSQHGHVEHLQWSTNRDRVFVTFSSVEEACATQKSLHNHISELSAVKKPMQCVHATRSDEKTVSPTLPQPAALHLDVLKAPPGLQLYDDFVSASEESALMTLFDSLGWEDNMKRRVQHFGYAFNYETRSVNVAFGMAKVVAKCCCLLFTHTFD
jgi:hypothetical protein